VRPADQARRRIESEVLLGVCRRPGLGIGAPSCAAYCRGEQPPFGYRVLSVDEIQGACLSRRSGGHDHLAYGLESLSLPLDLLSEETAAVGGAGSRSMRVLLEFDPLDGTKDFLQGTGEYAVHLA